MATRIEFIPFGDRWKPQSVSLKDGESRTFYRLPTTHRIDTLTPIIISAAYPDYTLVEFTYPGGSEPNQVQLSASEEELVIYRAMATAAPEGGRGTLKISHVPPSENDNEVLEKIEPHPSLDAHAEKDTSKLEEADPLLVGVVLAMTDYEIGQQRTEIVN